MRKIVLALIIAFAFSTTAMAGDIAISTHAGWFGQGAADREAQEIADNVTDATVEIFPSDQQDALADWVKAHTGDGVSDLLILSGRLPASIYPAGNAEPDGSLAELFLDDGNTIINTGDYLFYVTSSGPNNGTGGLQNMMDIAGISMWGDNTSVALTSEGHAVAPTLQDFQTDRPFHLNELEGDWVPELILAGNADGTRADPVIVVNTVTGGRLGIFYQTAGQDNDPRGEVISEWINNYYLTDGAIPNASAWKPNPADGAVDVDTTALEWTAGFGAVSQKVYLSTDATIDDADFLTEVGADLSLAVATLDPGATYYWRVDEVTADGSVIEGSVWSFSTLPLEAHFPYPPDGATNAISLTLSWTPGKNAIMHNVHFGKDPAALLPVQMMSMETTYDPGALDPETTYYWRVDEFTPTGTVAGPVWSFSTVGPVEPAGIADLIAYYPLAEDASSLAVLDHSGNNHHGVLVGNLTFVEDPEMGQVLSLPGGDNQFVDIGSVGISGNMPRTIMCWAKADNTSIPNWTLIFGFTGNESGGGGCGSHFNIGSLGGPGGVGAHAWCWEETIFSDQEALEWHHYAMSYDGTTIRYYGDGQYMDTDPGKSNVRDLSISADRVHIGSRVTQSSSFPGKVSDARIYDRVLTDEEIRVIGGDVTLPWSPDPAGGASGVPSTTVLSWKPGDGAVEQDVYFGTDAAAVAAADATDTTGIYRGRQAETAYTPLDLASDTTYYWRADQVQPDGTIVTGPVWSFSVALLIPASANLGACPTDIPGFLIYAFKPQDSAGWGYNGLNEILDTGLLNGVGAVEEGTRIDEFVNMRDTGNGAFSVGNGYPDRTFPGIDPLQIPAQDPAAGDDDNNYGAEVLGCVHLSAGLHKIGANSDDGTIVWIGGIEVGRTGEWKGASNVDFPPFEVAEDGYYDLKARWMEGGGGSSLELHEILADGTRLLLNDVANGASAVFAPTPVEEPVNTLINGGFEDGVVEPWSTYGALVTTMELVQDLVGAAVPESPIEGSNSLHVAVSDAGANFWDAGLQHTGHVFEAGKSYTLSVWLKSKSGPFQINMKPERAASPWEGYGEQAVTITEEWEQYAVSTGVIPETVDPASLTFHIAYGPGEFYVDDAVLTVE